MKHIGRMLIALAVLTALMPAAAAVDLMQEQQFTERVIAGIKEVHPDFDFTTLGKLGFSYKSRLPDSKEQGVVYLDNAYIEYQRTRDVDSVVKSRLQVIESLANRAKCEPANILPVIKSRGFVETAEKTFSPVERDGVAKNDGPLSIFDPFVGDLVSVYVLDSAKSTRFLREADLKDCGIDRERLRAISVENLRAKAVAFSVREISDNPRLLAITGDSYYETSTMLLDEYWDASRFHFSGDPVIAVPARGWVVIGDDADTKTVLTIGIIASRAARDQPYGISQKLYRRHDGKWLEYEP